MKPTAAFVLVAIFASLSYSEAFLCYEQEVGGTRGVTWCMNSCFTVGASVAGVSGVKKGCAEERYEGKCMNVGLPGVLSGLLNEHTCFCNYMLCNGTSMPSVFMPLLIIPYLLQKLI